MIHSDRRKFGSPETLLTELAPPWKNLLIWFAPLILSCLANVCVVLLLDSRILFKDLRPRYPTVFVAWPRECRVHFMHSIHCGGKEMYPFNAYRPFVHFINAP